MDWLENGDLSFTNGSRELRRVTPALQNTAVVGNTHPRAMVFDLDSTGAYVSTLFASNVGQSWHDGIAIDACGNLYVPEFWSAGLHRIDPDGNVTTIYDELRVHEPREPIAHAGAPNPSRRGR